MRLQTACGILCLAIGFTLLEMTGAARQVQPVVGNEAQHDISPALSAIQPLAPRGDDQEVHPVRPLPLPGSRGDALEPDPLLQREATRKLLVEKPVPFEGIGSGNPKEFKVGGAPSDTTGAAGPDHYVQWINTSFAIFDKAKGTIVYGPAAGNTLWSNFGGPCQRVNNGDPIVLYDRLAGRWLMSQFAVRDKEGFFQCVAVSRTSNPLGEYARYAFKYPDFNDYPKFGIWPDGYYVTYNMFSGATGPFLRATACALERDKMLNGEAARSICADIPQQGGLLPADLDGTAAPPAGTPNYLVNFAPDTLNLWRFSVNWAEPGKSAFTGPERIRVNTFDPACDGGACIVQPGNSASPLDTLADRLMFRAAYRNFATHRSLVVNHSVKVNLGKGRSTSGIRWYELRNLEGTPVVHQQSTYAPDDTFRWMGGIAMDKLGNMLMGYSASSSKVHPSIRITGRNVDDPPNTMAAEVTVTPGGGSQTISRWGDYTSLTLDPVDDCTFWFSTQYVKTDGSFIWRTQFSRVKFTGCK
jgi:hypothetical protein